MIQIRYRNLFIILSACAAVLSQAASFDCTKANSPVEKLICADADIGKQDAELAANYRRLMAIVKDQHDLAGDQRNWLKNTRDVCQDAPCLKRAYEVRNDELLDQYKHVHSPVAPDPSCSAKERPSKREQCHLISSCAENADHSVLEAITETCDADDPHYVTTYYFPNKGSQALLLDVWREGDFQYLTWGNKDRNGYAELDITGLCGAGPNCEHDLYHFDPTKKSLYHYFSGGYADLSFIDDYLIEAGRASCCSWEYHGYKIQQKGIRDVVEDQTITVVISQDLDDQSKPPFCYFSKIDDLKTGKAHTIKPPSKRWLELCKTYGDKFILN